MKKTSEPILFFGSGPVAAKSLGFLVDNFVIESVITKAVPSHHRDPAPVETLAKEQGLPIIFANTKGELDGLMSGRQFRSRLGVIIDYGVIVSQATIDSFELGILNSHFSLLPQWRGADPISFAVLSGDKKTGVSLMLIEPSLDTGKILVQKSLGVEPNDTTPTLTDKLITLSNQLLFDYLPLYLESKIKPHSQPHQDRATYSRKLTKDDGLLDWTKPAELLEREIRAFAGWPKSRTILGGKEIMITESKVAVLNGNPGQILQKQTSLIVACGQESLEIIKLKPAGKKEMTAKEFLQGYSQLLTTNY